MKTTLIIMCLFGLLLVSYSYAEDKPLSGEVFLGGRALSLDHQSAKFNEYNAVTGGLFGGGRFLFDNDIYHFDGSALYNGEDDMYLRLNGGKWGAFRYSLFYNEFPHNYSFGDRSIYAGAGTQNLTLAGSPSSVPRNSALWPTTSFDYKIRRKDIGGSFDVTALSPFFISIDADRLEREGTMPWGTASALGGSRTAEIPLPIDNTTWNSNLLVGYKSKPYYLGLAFNLSKFNQDAQFVRFQDAFTTGVATSSGTIVEAPDNKSWGLRLTGNAKLPLRSTFSLIGGYTKNTSDARLLNSVEAGTITAPIVKTLNVSNPTFRGDTDYWNVSGILTSRPAANLTTKLYFKYIDKKNNSDLVTFADPLTGRSVTNDLFDYQKTTMGAEGAYKFTKNLKGILGYDFTDTQRRVNSLALAGAVATTTTTLPFDMTQKIPDTWDNKIIAQLVYNPLDWLGARLKYQRLYRGAHFNVNPSPSSAADVMNNFQRPFNAANKTQDMIKAMIDLTPLSSLNLSLEYAYKHDDYNRTVLGFTSARQNEFVVDASYDWIGMKFFTFFDYDNSYTRQTSRSAGTNGDPNAPPTSNSFNWNVKLGNVNYAYGVGSAFPIIKNKLNFIVQYDFEKNNGIADFTSQYLPSNLNNDIIDMAPWDDYSRQMISAKLAFDFRQDLRVVFGYLYSQFRLNDGPLNNYQYVIAPNATSLSYLSGAYIDQSYKANLFYIKTMYSF